MEWLRSLTDVVRGLMIGRANIAADLTLTANQSSTVITDPRLHSRSIILPMPTTANAAAEIAAGTMWVSAQGDGTATITHASNAQTDRTFRIGILG